MDAKTKVALGGYVSLVMAEGMKSGLTWDETVAGLGLAAKALADGAARDGDGDHANCHAHARKRFDEAFAQDVRLIFAGSDLTPFEQYKVGKPS